MKKHLFNMTTKNNLKTDGWILLGLSIEGIIGISALSYETIMLLSHGDFHLIKNAKNEAKLGEIEDEDPAENGQEIP